MDILTVTNPRSTSGKDGAGESPGREADAWEQAQKVWAIPTNRRYPTTQSVYFALQNKFADPADSQTLEAIFDTRRGRRSRLGPAFFVDPDHVQLLETGH